MQHALNDANVFLPEDLLLALRRIRRWRFRVHGLSKPEPLQERLGGRTLVLLLLMGNRVPEGVTKFVGAIELRAKEVIGALAEWPLDH